MKQIGMICLAWLFLMGGFALAGSLEPTAPPGPTMHTLDEIYNKLEKIAPNASLNAAPVPKSGQTTSYTANDDGDLERGVALPSPRFTDNNDGTITDNLTGLMWTENADIGNGGRTSTQAISDCEACTAGDYTDWHLPQINELHSLVNYKYFSPSLSNTAGTGQWTAGDPFTNVKTSWYWSSTNHTADTGAVWGVHHGMSYVNGVYGLVYAADKGNEFYVWCVRGGPN